MPGIHSVGIIGLGLIGGSLARDLTVRGVRVHAADADPRSLRSALAEGAIDNLLEPSLDGLDRLDMVIIAVPVSAALKLFRHQAAPLAAAKLITDVCSTKQSLMQAAAEAGLADRFVGGHPLAGDHRAGWSASRRDLFRGATVYLCNCDQHDPQEHAYEARETPLARVRRMWESVGARCELIDAREHDRTLAWSSHLPQAASTALARALDCAGISRDGLGPGGRDMTRLALSSPDMWTPIAMDNAASLGPALAQMECELARLRDALARADEDAVRRFFEAGHPSTSVPDQPVT